MEKAPWLIHPCPLDASTAEKETGSDRFRCPNGHRFTVIDNPARPYLIEREIVEAAYPFTQAERERLDTYRHAVNAGFYRETV